MPKSRSLFTGHAVAVSTSDHLRGIRARERGKLPSGAAPRSSSFEDPEKSITSLLRFSFEMASCGMPRFVLLAAGTFYSD
jgi:hypothetical protein